LQKEASEQGKKGEKRARKHLRWLRYQ